jgi:geranylgeranyl diphosphate synthase type I
MLRYHLGWEDAEGRPADHPGKALRPALCLLACEAAGGDYRRALPAAAAVELAHNFSLVHDDIQDRDALRHHRPAVWTVWGEAQAINAGDALAALARIAVLGLRETGATDPAVIEAARLLDERTLEMVEGQAMDIAFEASMDVSIDNYMQMAAKKTGALFDCALAIGALAADAPASTVDAMGRCGRLLGEAFQARDDILGVWGAPGQTGKPAGADIRRRKKSLPVVYALSRPGSAPVHAAYESAELREEDVAEVVRALDACGARTYCEGVARERSQAALAALAGLDLAPGPAAELREVAAFLVERDY